MNQINEREEIEKIELLEQTNRQKEETIGQMRALIQEKEQKIEELSMKLETVEA